jgi:hypothetical protein
MKLFSEDLGTTKDNEELIALLKKFPAYDAGYLCQATGISRRKEKEWMEKLWQQYEPYADSHFLDDFKRQFTQRSWELYLGATLLNRGFKLGKHVSSGPDFDLQNNQNKRLTWIEAVAAEQGSGNDRVPDMAYGIVQNVPEEEMLLRIANALDQKFKKYQTELARGIVKGEEPYAIAVNRSGVGHVDPGLPLILKALFGIGHQTLRIRINGVRQENPEPFWSGRPKIEKRSGKDVPMLFFEDATHSGISAIIYCIDNILNSPRLLQEMGENFIIVHNPLAKNPLPYGFFPFGEEYKAEGGYILKIRKYKNWNKPNIFKSS